MNAIELRGHLEEEMTWRLDEVRFLKNQLGNISGYEDKKRYRKSLIVMLYSHFEGFCKASFLMYVQAINNESIERSRLNTRLVAASLSEEFRALRNKDKKSKIFKNDLPNDEKLHEYARQVDLLESLDDFMKKVAQIPEAIVDTESNLKPVVLRKILYRLGFRHDVFSAHEGAIQMLLHHRNHVAHGARVQGMDEDQYLEVEKSVRYLMTEIVELVFYALINEEFLKSS